MKVWAARPISLSGISLSESESSSVIMLAADNFFFRIAPLLVFGAAIFLLLLGCAFVTSSLTWNVAFGLAVASTVFVFFGMTYVARGDNGWL